MYKFESNTLQAIYDYTSQMEEVGVIIKNVLIDDHKLHSDEVEFDIAGNGTITVDGRQTRLDTRFIVFGETINLMVSQPGVHEPLLSKQYIITIKKDSTDGRIFNKLLELYTAKRELLVN